MTDTPTPIATSDAESNELDRLARRQGIRTQAAREEMERAPISVLQGQLRANQERLERAADVHQATTAPLQAELSQLEQEAVRRIANREPLDAEADGRRTEIIAEIDVANRELEKVVKDEKKTQRRLEVEISNLSCKFPPSEIILGKLAQPGFANPQLLVAKFVSEQRLRWAQTRLESARKSLAVYEANVAGILTAQRLNQRAADSPYAWGREVGSPVPRQGDLIFERRMCDCWAAEIQAAAVELDAARDEVKAICERIISE